MKELLSLDTHFRWNANLNRGCFYQFTLFQLTHTNFTGAKPKRRPKFYVSFHKRTSTHRRCTKEQSTKCVFEILTDSLNYS
jgi:hypothetical protein